MLWLRLHTDILADPKLMRAAREGAKCLSLTPWLLAFAKQADTGGRLTVGRVPAEPQDIAAMIPGTTTQTVQGCMNELTAIGVLVADEDKVLRFSRWNARQSKPSTALKAVRERVQKHRSAHRSAPPSGAGVLPGNAPHRVTPAPDSDRRLEDRKSVSTLQVTATPHLKGDGVTPKGVLQVPDVTPPEERRREEKRGEEKRAAGAEGPAAVEPRVPVGIFDTADSAAGAAPPAEAPGEAQARAQHRAKLLAQVAQVAGKPAP